MAPEQIAGAIIIYILFFNFIISHLYNNVLDSSYKVKSSFKNIDLKTRPRLSGIIPNNH